MKALQIYEMIKERKGFILEHNVVRIKVEQLFTKKEFKESICIVKTISMSNQVQVLSDKGK